MRIIYITDIHGHTEFISRLPKADLLLVGGDFTQFGDRNAVAEVLAALQQQSKHVLAVLGNLDAPDAQNVLTQNNAALTLTTATFDGLRLAGLGGANTSPFNTPFEWDDNTTDQTLSQIFPTPDALDILVSHAPPYDSGADRLPNGASVGSRAVAQAARRLRLPLLLCGHIHEADGIFDLDGTIVVNPGPFSDHGRHACINWQTGLRPTVWLA